MLDLGLPGAAAEEAEDADSSVTADAARESRLRRLLSSRSALAERAWMGAAAAIVEAASAVVGAAIAVPPLLL